MIASTLVLPVKLPKLDDVETRYRGKDLDRLVGGLEYAQSLGSIPEMNAAIEACREYLRELPEGDLATDTVQFYLGAGCYDLGARTKSVELLLEARTHLVPVAEDRGSVWRPGARYHFAGACLELGRIASDVNLLREAGITFREAHDLFVKFEMGETAFIAKVFAAFAMHEAAELDQEMLSFLRSGVHFESCALTLLETDDPRAFEEFSRHCRYGLQTSYLRTGVRYLGVLSRAVASKFAFKLGPEPGADLAAETKSGDWKRHRKVARLLERIFVNDIGDGSEKPEIVNAVRQKVRKDWGFDRDLQAPVEAAEVDSASESVLRRKGDNEEEARIDRDPAAVATDVELGGSFAGAVAALKSRLIPAVTDQDVAELEAVIHGAQGKLPADKEGFVRDVRRMLAAGGLQLRINGSDASVQLGMKNGSIQLMVSRQGSRSFRSADLRVERVDAEHAPEAAEAKTAQSHIPQ